MNREWVRRAGRHGLFWAAALAANLLIQLPAHVAIDAPLYVGGLFFNQLPASLLATYPLLYGVLPWLLRGRLLRFSGLLAGWLLLSVPLANFTRTLYEFVLGPAWFGSIPTRTFSWANLTSASFTWFMLVIIAGVAAAVKVVNRWYEQRQLEQELQQRRLRAELQLLKAQLQPEFLFGTLRTLRQLTARKSADSPAAVLHLSALLRYLLYESSQDEVPLTDEVEMLRHYAALEQLRLGSGVEVSLSFSGNLRAHRVAPLLLLPFVENAFRHGTGPHLECPWVSIDLVARRDTLIFKVINGQAPTGSAPPEGRGLRRIRQRLTSLYPGRYALKIVPEPDTFLVVLQLQHCPAASTSGAAALAQPATFHTITTN